MLIRLQILTILSFLAVLSCSKVDFDNPLDSKGSNYNSDLAKDSDGDGIPDAYDQDTKDTIKPVIKITGQDTTLLVIDSSFSQNLDKIVKQVSATDNRDGTITSQIYTDVSKISKFNTPGVYPIVYSVCDAAFNCDTATRYVKTYLPEQQDVTPPVLSLIGRDTIKLVVNDTYNELGASAYDVVNGTIIPIESSKISITGTVTTSAVGTYTIKYSVKDNAGNETHTTRTIIVEAGTPGKDVTPPEITLIGADTVTVANKSAYKEPGYKAIDNHDGDITSKVIVHKEQLDNSSDPGYYDIHYSVNDSANNSTSISRTVHVTGESGDVTKPVITIENSITSFTFKIGSSWHKLVPAPKASDNVDGNLTDSIKYTSNVDSTKAGDYKVQFYVYDRAGNKGTLDIAIKIVQGDIDTTKPVITLKGKNPDTVSVDSSSTYKDPGATATDNGKTFSGNIAVSGTVDMKTAGTDTLTYTATDSAGNTGTAKRIVVVKAGSVSNDLLTKYGVPTTSSLATLDLQNASFTTDGAQKPSLSGLTTMSISWANDAYNKSLWAFAITVNNNYKDLKSTTQTFASNGPTLTLSGTGISELDGEYYVTMKDASFVWVKKDGSFAIIWSK